MNTSFDQFLNEIRADSDTLQHALRMHLSEQSDDLTPEEMLDVMRNAGANEEELNRQLKILEQDPAAVEGVALTYLENAWENEKEKQSVSHTLEAAKEKLPVIEVTVIAVAAMYAMYLLATKGVTYRKVIKTKDKYETIEKREPFAPIMNFMDRLFGKKE